MELSKYINEILIHDNVDQEEKYLVTNTRTLSTRIIDRPSWEKVKSGRSGLLPPEFQADLQTCLFLVPEGVDEAEFLTHDQSQGGPLAYEIDLCSPDLPDAEVLASGILSALSEQGKELVDLWWNNLDTPQAFINFVQISRILQEGAKERGKFLQGKITTRRPDILPHLIELHEKFYVTLLEVVVSTAQFQLAGPVWDQVAKNIKGSGSSLAVQFNLLVDYGELEKVGSVMRSLAQLELQDFIHVHFTLLNEGPTLQEKRDFAEKEIEMIIELYHLGFPLPTLLSQAHRGPVERALADPCRKCGILPLCGGKAGTWSEDSPPCPTLKYNLKEKILLKYLFQGPKCVDLA